MGLTSKFRSPRLKLELFHEQFKVLCQEASFPGKLALFMQLLQ